MGGLFEMTRIFQAKHTLNQATFSAARAGALNDARLRPMTAKLASSMADRYTYDASPAGVIEAQARARLYGEAIQAAGGGVRIVSPTLDIFQALNTRQYLKIEGDDERRYQEVIPNDNLRWRARRTASVSDGDINLQDANLLKIRSVWCYRLIVPALDRVIYSIVNTFNTSDRQSVCNTISTGSQITGIATGRYLAITSDAIVRMQTPIVANDLP